VGLKIKGFTKAILLSFFAKIIPL